MKKTEEVEILERVKKSIMEGNSLEGYEKVLEDIERLQRESFMEGYCYAIEVLREGIVNNKEE